MSNSMPEKISLLIDDQLDVKVALKLTESIEKSPADAAKYSRYLLIGEILRSRNAVIQDPGFLARVREAIDDEPAILVPDWRKRLREQAVTLALAATLAGLAVIVGSSVIQQREQSSATIAAVDGRATDSLHDYLLTHNETAYLAANGGLMPYLRVVSGDRLGR